MTRKEITQIYYLNKEVEKLQEDLRKMRSAGLQSPKLDGMPRAAGGVGDPTASRAVSEADLEKKIEHRLKRIQRLRKKIWDYTDEIYDPLLRMIIEYRCISLCSWDEVAANVGGGNTADSVRKRFNRHFREAEKK